MQEINDKVHEKTKKKVCESKNGKAVDFACCLYYNIYNKRMAPKNGPYFYELLQICKWVKKDQNMSRFLSSEEQYDRMTKTPIPKLVSSLALPTTISMLVTVIYNTADTYFVSQINKSASAAVGMVYTLMAVIQAIGYGLGMGAGSLISRKLGEKKDSEADMYATSAFFAAIGFGALVGWGNLLFLEPILRFLKCTDTILPYAFDYARYILLAAPISCCSFVMNNTLRAEGESQIAMWGLGIGGLINIFLDPLFIFTLGMGAGGAALATAISQCISFAILLAVFLTGKSIVKIRLRSLSHRLRDYLLIFTTGLPTICRQGLGSLASAVLNVQAVVYGDAAVSAVTIANKLYVLVRNIIIGIGQGFQPAAGYNYSAGKRKRAWQAFTFSSLLGTVVCVVSAVALALFSRPLMQWFCDDAEVVQIGVPTLLYACAVMPFMAISTYVNQLYQCLGFKVPATFLASCRQGIFFLPAVWLLPAAIGCTGVQMSQPVADLATFILSIPFMISFYRKKIQTSDAEFSYNA